MAPERVAMASCDKKSEIADKKWQGAVTFIVLEIIFYHTDPSGLFTEWDYGF